jgi:hypothetical protein
VPDVVLAENDAFHDTDYAIIETQLLISAPSFASAFAHRQ